MKEIRKPIQQMKQFFVLQEAEKAKLNQNETPFDLPAEFKEEIFSIYKKMEWNRYPIYHPTNLINTISNYIDYPSSGIVVGNGSSEIIQIVLSSFCNGGDRISLIQPGFLLYNRLAVIMDFKVTNIPLLDKFEFDVSSIIDNSRDTDLLVVVNPNNPTGTVLSLEEIEEIVKNVDAPVIFDEAYYEFYKQSAQEIMNKYDNIMLIRTFSKAIGLAGSRLGYLVAKPEYADHIEKSKLMFSVDTFQQVIGEYIFKQRDFIDKIVKLIASEREKVFSLLNNINNIEPIPSFTNFILFEVKDKSAAEVTKLLEERGILVRYAPIPRIENFIRVTIGTPEENEVFIDNLRDIMEG